MPNTPLPLKYLKLGTPAEDEGIQFLDAVNSRLLEILKETILEVGRKLAEAEKGTD